MAESDLVMVDRRLARARERVEQQRELIEQLAASRQDTASAEALFRAMRRTLESVEEDRRVIEDEVFAFAATRT
jgi:hypothetical protein